MRIDESVPVCVCECVSDASDVHAHKHLPSKTRNVPSIKYFACFVSSFSVARLETLLRSSVNSIRNTGTLRSTEWYYNFFLLIITGRNDTRTFMIVRFRETIQACHQRGRSVKSSHGRFVIGTSDFSVYEFTDVRVAAAKEGGSLFRCRGVTVIPCTIETRRRVLFDS